MLAGRLLRALAVCQYIAKSSPVVTAHIKGTKNIRADNASRWFNNHRNRKDPKLSNKEFLLKSSHTIQKKSWEEFNLSSALSSKMINELRGKPSTLASWIRTLLRGGNIGGVGSNTPATRVSALISKRKPMIRWSLLSDLQRESGLVHMDEEKELAFKASQMRW